MKDRKENRWMGCEKGWVFLYEADIEKKPKLYIKKISLKTIKKEMTQNGLIKSRNVTGCHTKN